MLGAAGVSEDYVAQFKYRPIRVRRDLEKDLQKKSVQTENKPEDFLFEAAGVGEDYVAQLDGTGDNGYLLGSAVDGYRWLTINEVKN